MTNITFTWPSPAAELAHKAGVGVLRSSVGPLKGEQMYALSIEFPGLDTQGMDVELKFRATVYIDNPPVGTEDVLRHLAVVLRHWMGEHWEYPRERLAWRGQAVRNSRALDTADILNRILYLVFVGETRVANARITRE